MADLTLPAMTIGIEEEYQIIDPETGALTSYVQEFFDEGRMVLQDQIKPEFLQSMVEVGSRICRDVQEARQELIRLRRAVADLSSSHGHRMIAASTHPFSSWSDQQVSAGERYTKLEDDLGVVARRLLIFGMHVHIGFEDRELLIDVMNQSMYFMPHILALSTSSPFWQGRNTGLKSYRTVVCENLPRAGLPPTFDSYADYERFVRVLLETNCIDEATKIWWDVRPHPKYHTLEFRIADICTRVDEAICITALLQAVVAKLVLLRRRNQSWRRYRRHLINENKWRAVRYGIDGHLIDFGQRKEVPMRVLTVELLELVDDVLDDLGIRKEVEYAHTILEHGTSADRQIQAFEESGDFKVVIDRLATETLEGCES